MPLGLTPPPTAPSLSDPATFPARASAFVAWFVTFITEWAALSASQFFAVLGTVSQSGGVPTGAIFERGSNANGEYVRFADGTQICTFTAAAVDATTATGNVYNHTNALVWTYPAAFVTGTTAVVSGNGGSTGRWLALATGNHVTVGYRVLSAISSATAHTPSLTAIGRWS